MSLHRNNDMLGVMIILTIRPFWPQINGAVNSLTQLVYNCVK